MTERLVLFIENCAYSVGCQFVFFCICSVSLKQVQTKPVWHNQLPLQQDLGQNGAH